MSQISSKKIRQQILSVVMGLLALGSVENAWAASSIRVIAGSAENCVVSSGHREAAPLALAMALGSSVIRTSVSALGSYLTKAAQSTSSPIMTGIGATDLFRVTGGSGNNIQVTPNLECLVIISGVFGDLGTKGITTDYAAAADPDGIFVRISNGQTDVSRLRTLGLIDFPNSYFEFRLDKHNASEAVRLTPTLVYFRASNTTRNTQDAKNIEITITVVKPSSTGSLDPKAIQSDSGLVMQIPVVLKQLVPGRVRKAGIPNLDTVWIAAPKLPSENDLKDARGLVGNGGYITFSPANVFVTYRETDEPDLMFSILASIVTGNATPIDTALEDTLRSLLTKGSK
jgi:hypothetical protein